MMVCSMRCMYLMFWMFISLPMWSWDVGVWDTWPNHFWSHRLVILGLLSSHHDGAKFFICDMFNLTILGVFDQYYFGILSSFLLRTEVYCDLFWDIFLVAHWEPMDIVIYYLMLFSYSSRTDVIIVDYLLMLSSHLYRTEVILWFLLSWA